jgi:hypothetical protein
LEIQRRRILPWSCELRIESPQKKFEDEDEILSSVMQRLKGEEFFPVELYINLVYM